MKAIDFYKDMIKGFEEMDFAQRRDAVDNEGIDNKKMHTKATLKALFRLKPSKDAEPAGSYVNDYKNEINLYRIDQCVPMRELIKKPRTEAQIAAAENLAKASKMSSKKCKLVAEAKKYIENDLIVIDTETTDLDGEVIQICAASSRSGEVIFESLVKSDKPIAQGAFEKHGFTDEDIKDAPSFEQIATELGETIGHRKWASFNIQFDLDALLNSRHNKEADCYKWITENCSHYCLMKLAAEIYGSTNSYGSISLADAMHYSGSKWRGRAHDATADTLAATDVLKAIAKNDS